MERAAQLHKLAAWLNEQARHNEQEALHGAVPQEKKYMDIGRACAFEEAALLVQKEAEKLELERA